jgi:hypothetical protein
VAGLLRRSCRLLSADHARKINQTERLQRIKNSPQTPVGRYDIIGEYSKTGPGDFIRHVGLAVNSVAGIGDNEIISVAHMGPPLENSGTMSAQIVGSANLTVDDIEQIRIFIDERLPEHAAAVKRSGKHKTYVVRPHVQAEPGRDGTVIFYRYSCAGFIIEAYRSAGIRFIETAEDKLPLVSLELIMKAYADLFLHGDRPKARKLMGIEGDGPWRVILAGYILHALNRPDEMLRQTPYQPVAGNESFSGIIE